MFETDEESPPDKERQSEEVPKKEAIEKQFWFVNAGLLPASVYDKAVIHVSTTKLSMPDLHFVLFLGTKYIIHYLELYTFDPTPLLTECIYRHLKYMQLLIGKQRNSQKFLNYSFITKTQSIFDKLAMTKICDHICRQMYIDQLEKICSLFSARLLIWLKSGRLQAYLYRYGFDPYRSSAIYNSFLIPNESRYVDPLLRMDQKLIEKIESKCHCKILLTAENLNCTLTPEYIILEVIFDLYKGNYIGFLDMLTYIVKRLNSSNFFAKSLRTVLIEGSCLYNILTNVPVRKLKYLEKTVIAGLPVTPFLESNSVSKQLFSIVSALREEDQDVVRQISAEIEREISKDREDVNSEFGKPEETSMCYYEKHTTQNELLNLQNYNDVVNVSHNIIKYFDYKYQQKMVQKFTNSAFDGISCTKSENEKFNLVDVPLSHSPETNTTIISKDNEVTEHDDEHVIVATEDVVNPQNRNVNHKAFYMSPTTKSSGLPKKSYNYNQVVEHEIQEEEIPNDGDQKYYVQINENNDLSAISKSIEIFNNLTKEEQFSMIVNECISDYSDPNKWLNHRLRRLLHCNTDEVAEESKHPYQYKPESIHEKWIKFFNSPKSEFYCDGLDQIALSNCIKVPRVDDSTEKNSLSNKNWMPRHANRVLSNEPETKSISKASTATNRNLDIEEFQKRYPKEYSYLSKHNDDKILQQFIRNKLFLHREWLNLLDLGLEFQSTFNPRALQFNTLELLKSYSQTLSDSKNSFTTQTKQHIYGFLHKITNGKITVKHYRQMLNGFGLNVNFINKINRCRANPPTLVGIISASNELESPINLSTILCQLCHDLYEMATYGVRNMTHTYTEHMTSLLEILQHCDEDVKIACRVLQLWKKLNSVDLDYSYQLSRSQKSLMMKLAQEINILHTFIFKRPCVFSSQDRQNSCIVIYNSIQVETRLAIMEPFLKLPGDKRISKIENQCQCIITLRSKHHPVIPVDEYVIDIFYDFESGKHLECMEMLKSLIGRTKNKMSTISSHRTLVLYPYGEMWVFHKPDWLERTCVKLNNYSFEETFRSTNEYFTGEI